MFNRKAWLTFVLVVVLVMGITGVISAEKIKIVVADWEPEGRGPISTILQKCREDHPELEIEQVYYGSDHFDKLLVNIATGGGPDIYLWWDFPALAEGGFAVDLLPYMLESEVLHPDNFFPGALNYGGKYKDGIYATPHSFTPRAILVNLDAFDVAGLAYPTDDWTWDEFRNIALKLTRPDENKYGFNWYWGVYNIGGFIWGNGGDFVNEDATQAIGYIDSPETIEAVTWLANLRLLDGVMPLSGALQSGQGFATGNIAMMETGAWNLLVSKEANPNIRMMSVVPPAPEGKSPGSVLHSSGWVVSPNCQNIEAAMIVLEYLSGPIGQREMVIQDAALPTLPSVVTEFQLWNDPESGGFVRAVEYATTTHWFLRTPRWNSEYQGVVQDALNQIFNGQAAPATALRAAGEALQGIMDSYK